MKLDEAINVLSEMLADNPDGYLREPNAGLEYNVAKIRDWLVELREHRKIKVTTLYQAKALWSMGVRNNLEMTILLHRKLWGTYIPSVINDYKDHGYDVQYVKREAFDKMFKDISMYLNVGPYPKQYCFLCDYASRLPDYSCKNCPLNPKDENAAMKCYRYWQRRHKEVTGLDPDINHWRHACLFGLYDIFCDLLKHREFEDAKALAIVIANLPIQIGRV